MENFNDYLNERVDVSISDIVMEANDTRYLIDTAENALLFFEKYDVFNHLGKLNLTEGMIREIYDIAVKNNQSCPIVGNYGNKPGQFAFRRWVDKYADELGIEFNLEKTTGYYKGLHNTNLKENGKFFPNAADDESIIAFLHNKWQVNKDLTDGENIEYVTKKTLETGTKQEQLVLHCLQYQNDHTDGTDTEKGIESTLNREGYISGLSSDIGMLSKLPFTDNISAEWLTVGQYPGSASKTPKTDIISDDGKYRISVKKRGGSQLMSGGQSETRATLYFAARKCEPDGVGPIHDGLNELFQNYPDAINDVNDEHAQEKKAAMNKCEDILEELTKNMEFRKAIVAESATGVGKFGPDAKSTANYVYIYDREKKSELIPMDKFIESHYKDVKFTFGHKSTKGIGTRTVNMRIVLK
jgi:hypothetical protein